MTQFGDSDGADGSASTRGVGDLDGFACLGGGRECPRGAVSGAVCCGASTDEGGLEGVMVGLSLAMKNCVYSVSQRLGL